jgi:hypothetical protein
MSTGTDKRVTPVSVAAALARVIELTDAGAPPKKRAAARAHAEALCRRWKLSLREGQAAPGRLVEEQSIAVTQVGTGSRLCERNASGTRG